MPSPVFKAIVQYTVHKLETTVPRFFVKYIFQVKLKVWSNFLYLNEDLMFFNVIINL